MSYYGYWGGTRERDARAFDEKAFRRKDLATWDARWHALSSRARLAFLDDVKGPVKRQGQARDTTGQPSVPSDKFPPEVVKELTDAGFVEVRPGPSKTQP